MYHPEILRRFIQNSEQLELVRNDQEIICFHRIDNLSWTVKDVQSR